MTKAISDLERWCPSVERPSLERPSFECPSFDCPSLESPSLECPYFECPSSNVRLRNIRLLNVCLLTVRLWTVRLRNVRLLSVCLLKVPLGMTVYGMSVFPQCPSKLLLMIAIKAIINITQLQKLCLHDVTSSIIGVIHTIRPRPRADRDAVLLCLRARHRSMATLSYYRPKQL